RFGFAGFHTSRRDRNCLALCALGAKLKQLAKGYRCLPTWTGLKTRRVSLSAIWRAGILCRRAPITVRSAISDLPCFFSPASSQFLSFSVFFDRNLVLLKRYEKAGMNSSESPFLLFLGTLKPPPSFSLPEGTRRWNILLLFY